MIGIQDIDYGIKIYAISVGQFLHTIDGRVLRFIVFPGSHDRILGRNTLLDYFRPHFRGDKSGDGGNPFRVLFSFGFGIAFNNFGGGDSLIQAFKFSLNLFGS